MANKFNFSKVIKIVKNAREWFMIIFLVIVALTMFLFLAWGAKKTAENYIPSVAKIRPEDIKFPTEGAQAVGKMLEGLKPFDDSDYKDRLLSRNLYDFRDVMNRYDLERKLNDKLKTAQVLFEQKNYDETIRLCQEILAQDSSRVPAIQLKEKAEAAKATSKN